MGASPALPKPCRVVVLGGGFGGVYVARRLLRKASKGEVEVCLVSRSPSFLFTPLLHEVATGGLSAESVAVPLRQVFGGRARVTVGEAASVDTDRRVVRVRRAEGGEAEVPYDALVVALGARPNFYGTPGAEERALPLETLEDAARIRAASVAAFGRADREGRAPTFAVVGGGPTGVELAAELAEVCHGTLAKAYPGAARAKVALVSAGADILPMLRARGRGKALAALRRIGVDVRLSATVTAVEEGAVVLGAERLAADVTVWAAGVAAAPLPEGLSVSLDKTGRALVDATLRAQDHPEIFVLGDQAAGAPMLAQAATQQATVVADAILAGVRGETPRAFTYRPQGALVSLGHWRAVGEVHGVTVSGPLAWWLWRTVYLFKFPSVWKRLRVAAEWTIGIFFPRDLSA